ncbi:MAG: single-stranded DNA-binding protein, partial [Phenylobacterium zucineum]
RKGSKIYVEGQIQTRKWADQSGQEKYSTEVVLQKFGGAITLLSGRDSDEGSDRGARDEGGHGGSYGGGGFSGGGERRGYDDTRPREDFTLDDEIPFVTNWALR